MVAAFFDLLERGRHETASLSVRKQPRSGLRGL